MADSLALPTAPYAHRPRGALAPLITVSDHDRLACLALEERPGHVSRGGSVAPQDQFTTQDLFFFFGSRTDRLRQAESHEWVGEGKLSKHFNISIFISLR